MFEKKKVFLTILKSLLNISLIFPFVYSNGNNVIIQWILHDWTDDECVKILKKCKEAITSNGKNGKVIIIDMVVGNKSNKKNMKNNDMLMTKGKLFWDLLMMVNVGGKERDEKEWAELFQAAGFGAYNISPILGLRSLIELYP